MYAASLIMLQVKVSHMQLLFWVLSFPMTHCAYGLRGLLLAYSRMADSVAKIPRIARDILERAILAGDEPIVLHSDSATQMHIDAVRMLAGEGWLRPLRNLNDDAFVFTSRLVRAIAVNKLASMRSPTFHTSLPYTDTGRLDVPTVILQSMTEFRPASLSSSLTLSSKTCEVSKMRVPNEATYHYELYSVLCLRLCNHCNFGDVFPEADVLGGRNKRFADILVVDKRDGSKSLIELVASASAASVAEHFDRLTGYMSAHKASGTCVSFSVSNDAADDEWEMLTWPSKRQRSMGLVAMHVVHDDSFGSARVFTLPPEAEIPSKCVLRLNGE